MLIPQKLPQFETGAALIIATGTEEADFYLANEGEINKVDSFELEKDNYSDREDVGKVGGAGGHGYETGARFERMHKMQRINFLKEFKAHLKSATAGNKLKSVYLFAPAEVYKELKAALPASLQKVMRRTEKGNVHKEGPIKLLQRIQKA